MITQNTNPQNLMKLAQKAVKELRPGEQFIVKDLFRGFEWQRIPVSYRARLGSMFLSYAVGLGSYELLVCGKTPQKQQIYEKK